MQERGALYVCTSNPSSPGSVPRERDDLMFARSTDAWDAGTVSPDAARVRDRYQKKAIPMVWMTRKDIENQFTKT